MLAPLSLEARALRCLIHVRDTGEPTILCVGAGDLERARELIGKAPVIVAQCGGNRVTNFLRAYEMQIRDEFRGRR